MILFQFSEKQHILKIPSSINPKWFLLVVPYVPILDKLSSLFLSFAIEKVDGAFEPLSWISDCWNRDLLQSSGPPQAKVRNASRGKCEKIQGKYRRSFCSKAYCLRPSHGQTIWRGTLATAAIAFDAMAIVATLEGTPLQGEFTLLIKNNKDKDKN